MKTFRKITMLIPAILLVFIISCDCNIKECEGDDCDVFKTEKYTCGKDCHVKCIKPSPTPGLCDVAKCTGECLLFVMDCINSGHTASRDKDGSYICTRK